MIDVCPHGGYRNGTSPSGIRRECEACDALEKLERLDPIMAVWEKYQHLDQFLGDFEWLGAGSTWRAEIMHDLWVAVRAAAGHA